MHYLRLIRGEYITCTQSKGSMHYLRPIRVENRISDQSDGSMNYLRPISEGSKLSVTNSEKYVLPGTIQKGVKNVRPIRREYNTCNQSEGRMPFRGKYVTCDQSDVIKETATNHRGVYFMRPIRGEYELPTTN